MDVLAAIAFLTLAVAFVYHAGYGSLPIENPWGKP